MLQNFFFHYQLEANNFGEKKNPVIPFVSLLLNLYCLSISLGVQDKLDVGNAQYSLARRLINYRSWENKDIESVRSIKFYNFCDLCRVK